MEKNDTLIQVIDNLILKGNGDLCSKCAYKPDVGVCRKKEGIGLKACRDGLIEKARLESEITAEEYLRLSIEFCVEKSKLKQCGTSKCPFWTKSVRQPYCAKRDYEQMRISEAVEFITNFRNERNKDEHKRFLEFFTAEENGRK